MEDHSESFFDLVERISQRSVSGSGCGGSGVAGSSGPRSAAAHYLESTSKHCDTGSRERFEAVACGCRNWFCPDCCVGKGLRLRERLVAILETFTNVMMWTFTLDPTLFSGPEQAFDYVRAKRCISNVMRRLRERGFLHSGRYFVVIEWQDNGMPHWHLLCDSSYVPFELVCSLWNRFRPSSAGPVQGERPGFGAVRFSAPTFNSKRHAANYACAYLIQHPQNGYPEWIMPRNDIHRYSTSRGFWGTKEEPDDLSDDLTGPLDFDACPCCGSDADGAGEHCEDCGWSVSDESQIPDLPEERRKRRPIGERLKACAETSILVRLRDEVDESTGELVLRREFCGRLTVPLVEATAFIERPIEGKVRRVEIGAKDARRLLARFGVRRE